jgi:hypothetical protein
MTHDHAFLQAIILDDPRRPELEARERQLLKQHGKKWAAPVLSPLAGMVIPP